jgi:O-antigen/teichoic acid export membrane protein
VSTLRQYVRNIAALIGQSTVQRMLGMLTTVVLARVLGVAGFGAYSAIINTANSAYGIVRLGTDASIHVHTAEADQGENSRQDKGDMLGAGLLLLLVSGVVGAAACLLLSNWLAKTVYGQPELSHWMSFAAGLVLLQCVSQFCYASLVGLHQFVTYSWVMFFSAVISTLAVSIGAYFLGTSGALASMLVAQAVTVVLLARSARGALHAQDILLRFGAVKKWAYRHLRFGLPFYAAGLFSVPVALYLQGMLSRHSGLESLGELRVITAILSLISFIPTAASSAMISLLTRSSTNNYLSFVQQTLLHIKYIWIFAVFSGLGVFLVLPLIIKLLFGGSYMGVVVPMSYAIMSTIISCVLGFAGNIILARRRVGLLLAQTICQFSLFAGIASILIPKMGLRGYLVAELSGYVAAIVFIYFTAIPWKKRHVVSISWLVPSILLSIADGIGLLLLSLPAMEEYRMMAAVLLIVATALVIYLLVLDGQDRALLAKYIRQLLTPKNR